MITDAGVPDALKPAEMRRKHHVIAGARYRLNDRKIAMCPAFLKTEVNKRGAFGEMVVSS